MSIAENALPPRTLLNFESLYSEEMYRLQWVRMGKCSVITALCSFLTAVCTLAGSYLQLKSPAQDSGFSDGVSEMGDGRWAGWRDGQSGGTRRYSLVGILCRSSLPHRITCTVPACRVVVEAPARPMRGGRVSCLPPVWYAPKLGLTTMTKIKGV